MKKIYFTLLFFFFFYSQGFSQEIEMNEIQLKKYLCKSWKIDHVLINGQEVSGIDSFKEMEFKFITDGTYTIKDKTENVPGRIWRYNIANKCVEIFSDKEIIERIKYVDTNKIVIIPVLNKHVITIMKSVELYLRPY